MKKQYGHLKGKQIEKIKKSGVEVLFLMKSNILPIDVGENKKHIMLKLITDYRYDIVP